MWGQVSPTLSGGGRYVPVRVARRWLLRATSTLPTLWLLRRFLLHRRDTSSGRKLQEAVEMGPHSLHIVIIIVIIFLSVFVG